MEICAKQRAALKFSVAAPVRIAPVPLFQWDVITQKTRVFARDHSRRGATKRPDNVSICGAMRHLPASHSEYDRLVIIFKLSAFLALPALNAMEYFML